MLAKNKGEDVVISHTNRQRLMCNLAHQLPFYQKQFPLYDRQLARLCLFLHKRLNRTINIIDVGANVGDTVLNIGLKDAFYLCIEGNGTYSKYIKSNLRKYNYSLEEVFLNDDDTLCNYNIEASNGTGHLIYAKKQDKGVRLVTLDSLLESKYPEKEIDLLKIDTDGFDFKVIRGAQNCLQKWHPLLFFEWDKVFCKEQGEDPLNIFPILEELDYKECLLFDNFGNVFDKVDTNNTALLKSYIDNTIGDALPYYYDILAIPQNYALSIKQIYNLFFQ
jgi:FkbM family methyltransferase